ncbi:MAG: glutamine-hydrolyzing carbamoyl-phosphate synthase small subunit [Nanoarchaeota archaeon]|nr:glutamine-hydrolyzing carbamoyl-phosphate synthase small subunit [Nanoarchaeota archaeon]
MVVGKTSGIASLVLKDGTVFSGISFGARTSTAGEVVFNTGMVGYPESLTDPSYAGQILVLTYPLVGNYGVPPHDVENGLLKFFESSKIHIKGLIVADYSREYSHWNAKSSLSEWMAQEGIPGISGIDTRALTKKLRTHGTMLGKIEQPGKTIDFYDPNKENLVAQVSPKEVQIYGTGKTRILLVDTGCKNNIIRSFVSRGAKVIRVPYDYDFTKKAYDGLFIANGPGDPKMCTATIEHLRQALVQEKPVFGICLGNQLLALASGADTYKLKFGHRGQNQPCIEVGTKRCYITSQNHGFAVDTKTLQKGWKEWFVNANDGTNEGIIHSNKPFFSVQFHPEATPGPVDTTWLFDRFLRIVRGGR